MRFILIDRIVELREGESITALKALSLAEEYLRDHFPRFPVMPGVLMLEAMFQASAWLIRKGDGFRSTLVMLEEARNVRYADFVQPGQQLTVKAEILKQFDRRTTLKTVGLVDDQVAVSARLELRRGTLAESDPREQAMDEFARREMKKIFALLYQPARSLETAG